MTTKTFASDNYAGVHPEVMEALIRANQNHAGSYGADVYTQEAINKFKSFFGSNIEVFFVYNGTGANVLSLQSATQSFNSIICSDLAHINVDESTAPEKFLGCKLVTIPTKDGKIYADQIEARIQRIDDQHHPQAKVISISQSTEYATVYTIEELKAISSVAKKYNLYFHMDGSRISNAAVSLNANFAAFTRDVGVDVLSFGGTKNGMMFGEAIVFLNSKLAENFRFIRKQGMQLHSKMRFISAQFNALLDNDLWRKSASHANNMAKYLETALKGIPGVKLTQKVDANGIFAIMPEGTIEELQKEAHFYIWNERTSEVRLMCAFDTTKDDIDRFIEKLRQLTRV
ncbi:threonine aldolase family protein [Chryseosolibacter indicus]|uniref:Low specificity L-threonine aldolase n=1 Tax=Chryseosolibacter indicus TaxID=2782351 RepID=A0ABS5VVY4_9BACT|nr:low specificity L-threonine aldolase [Chryseosolibacter indicus]MBT1704977.1 low specificity L-threonine aldolase [Chryseosolibacter indicus]